MNLCLLADKATQRPLSRQHSKGNIQLEKSKNSIKLSQKLYISETFQEQKQVWP